MLEPLLLKCCQPESAKHSLIFSVSGLTWGNHIKPLALWLYDGWEVNWYLPYHFGILVWWQIVWRRYEYVLTNKIVFFWDVLLSGLVDRCHSFSGTYCCHVQINLVCLDDESIKFQWNIGICPLNYTLAHPRAPWFPPFSNFLFIIILVWIWLLGCYVMWSVTPGYLCCKTAIICHFLLLLGYISFHLFHIPLILYIYGNSNV